MKRFAILVAALYLPAALAAYKCVDEKGKTHIGDTPPPGCADVPMQEVTRGGKVLRTIEPTLTEEQVKAKAEEAERKRAADKVAGEQKRKDAALLASFASEKEFDVARDRNVDPIKGRINVANERLKQLDKQEEKIKEEMEFYKAGKGKAGKGKEMPSNLTDGLKGAEAERATIKKNIANYEREIEEIRAKFDTDKKRWVAIKNEPKTAPAADKSAAKKN